MDKAQRFAYNKKVVTLAVFFGVISVLKIFILHDKSFVTSHLSNFGLTGLLLSSSLIAVGKFNAKKAKRDFIQALVICVALNLILEFGGTIGDLKLPFGITFESFNVADPVDALFGLVATAVVLAAKKYWIKPTLAP